MSEPIPLVRYPKKLRLLASSAIAPWSSVPMAAFEVKKTNITSVLVSKQ